MECGGGTLSVLQEDPPTPLPAPETAGREFRPAGDESRWPSGPNTRRESRGVAGSFQGEGLEHPGEQELGVGAARC